LEDTPGFRRMAQCFSCASVFALPAKELVAGFGADAPLAQALASLKCPNCLASPVGVTLARR
jgi:hypothetical protein